MLTGLPSVIAGLVAYAAIVLGGQIILGQPTFSAVAAGIALAILMIPTILLTAEDAIKMVPAGEEGRYELRLKGVIVVDPSGQSFIRHDEDERFRFGARDIFR